jgi:Short C-terminal domain
MIMRRRPLLRAAAVAGGAYMAGKSTANRRAEQEQANAEQDTRIGQLEQQQAAPPAAAAAPPAAASLSDQLNELKTLHGQGVLTDEEFSAAKAKLIGI